MRYLFGTIILFSLPLWNSFAQESPMTHADSMEYYRNTRKIVEGISQPNIVEFAPSISADGKTLIFESNQSGGYKLFESKKSESGAWSDPEPLEKINARGDSTVLIGGPSVSFDGNSLYFFAFFDDSYGLEDIYLSRREKDGWGEPVNLGPPVNTSDYEGFPSISSDGSTLFFIRYNKEGPQDKDLRKLNLPCYSIYKSEKKDDGSWGEPVKLPNPINLECEKAPRIMADNRTLVFASNRPGGLGEYDLYQTQLNVYDEWDPPVPLEYVNSEKSDQFCAISASGDLMYFVFNVNDIYSVVIPPQLRQFVNVTIQGYITDADTKEGIPARVKITDAESSSVVSELDNNPADGWFSLVLAAGKKYNVEITKEGYSSAVLFYDLSKDDEYREIREDIELFSTVKLTVNINDVELFEAIPADVKIKLPGEAQFFKEVKNNPVDGRANVELPIGKDYEVIVASPNFKGEFFHFNLSGQVLYRDFEKDTELKPEKVEVQLNVTDLVNNGKVKSKLRIRNKNRDEVIEVNGNETVALRVGDRYEIEATSDQGYAFNSTELDVAKGGGQSVNLQLQPLIVNANLTLKDILFESNSADLNEISFVELNRVIKLMQTNPGLKVEIAAHTDDVGSKRYNLKLSEKRASSVVQYLTDNNVPEERFTDKGYGEEKPVVPNDTEENRARNRRVELKILQI
jgi:outer membrane protein OmpA-like peptidoglycan-associated protein